jgi:prepilin-type N-terminal cleavage/methylation domain-containing protein
MNKRRAFSIAEMMITLTIFSIVSAVAMNVLYNSMRTAKSVQAQVFLYTESQALMDQIGRVIERNTIDYEAYYLRIVQGEKGWESEDYGYYAQTFFDPASGGPVDGGPYDLNASVLGYSDGYGTYCSGTTDAFPDDCTYPFADSTSADINQFTHPYSTTIDDLEDWNAFCEDSNTCSEFENQIQDVLILVNSDGDERVIFGLEDVDGTGPSSDNYLSKVEMVGSDSDGDGVEDTWVCNSRYSCNKSGNSPKNLDLRNVTIAENISGEQEDFMPISPSSISVTDFYVILGPIEDPYRAVGEEDSQIQPQVTIVMTVTLSEDYGANILGDPPSITFQRTVSTGVYNEVISYE